MAGLSLDKLDPKDAVPEHPQNPAAVWLERLSSKEWGSLRGRHAE